MNIFSKNSNRGFTLVEIIVVLVIVAVLAASSIPTMIGFVEEAKGKSEIANARAVYTACQSISTEEYVSGNQNTLESDSTYKIGDSSGNKKLNNMLSEDFKFKNDENPAQVTPTITSGKVSKVVYRSKYRSGEASYVVTIEPGKEAVVEKNINNGTHYDFTGKNSNGFILDKYWKSEDGGLVGNYTGADKNGVAFMKNNKSEYTLETVFNLNSNQNKNGGLGLFFETALDSNYKENGKGYVLQFDRGYGAGEIIVRERNNGVEKSQPIARFTNVPSKSDVDFWESEQKMSVVVKNSQVEGKKDVTLILNSQVLGNVQIDALPSSDNSYTGFRTWHGAPVTVKSLNIE